MKKQQMKALWLYIYTHKWSLKKNKKENIKGITLISMVVTIIILLILAGVGIQALTNTGLFEKSKKATEEYSMQQAKERLIQTLTLLAINKVDDKNYNENEYIDNQIKEDGMKIDENDVVTVDGYRFKIDRKTLSIEKEFGKDQMSEFENLKTNYIQDGLVCWYDGEYNTKNGHNETTTIWEDLTGNNNDGILKNINNTKDSGWTSNSLILDGIDDWVQMTKIPASDKGITIQIVARFIDTNDNKQENLICNQESGGIGIIKKEGKLGSATYINKYVDLFENEKMKIHKIYSLSTSMNAKEKKICFSSNNNIQETLFLETYSEPEKDTIFAIGTNPTGKNSELSSTEAMSNIEVYSVRIYNRSLTQEEIDKNTEQDIKRFKIEEIMVTPTASDLGYVDNGLMCLYDGEYNSEFGKSKKTNNWYDLSNNNNNGTLTNFNLNNASGWTGNSLLFDGIDDWVAMKYLYSNNITVEIASRIVSEKAGKKLYMIDNYESGGIGIERTTDGYMLGAVNINGTYYTLKSNDSNSNMKYSMTLKYDGTNINFRENENKYSLPIVGIIKAPVSSTIFALGVNPIGNNYTIEKEEAFNNFEVYSVRIYNRALSEEEIIQNYNVDKNRFGI